VPSIVAVQMTPMATEIRNVGTAERPTVEQGAPTLLQAQLACHDDGEGHQADRDGDQRVDGTVGDRLEGREAVDQTAERERGQGDGERRARSGGALPGVL
jgi:hypothetical protein